MRSARRSAIQVLMLILAVVLSACGMNTERSDAPVPFDAPNTLEFSNFNASDVVVYAERVGANSRDRLGYVTSNQTASFDLPRWADFERVRVAVEMVGGDERYAFRPVMIEPGFWGAYTYENAPEFSIVEVRAYERTVVRR